VVGYDIHIFVASTSREAQLVRTLSYFDIHTVWDVGANEGQFGRDLFDAGYKGNVLSFEPLVEAHEKITRTAKNYSGWKIYPPIAVGSVDGYIDFHVAENSVSSSALKVLSASTAAAPESRQVSARKVPVTTVDSITRHYALSGRHCMLKVDTQGYEWLVLDGAQESLSKFDLVLLELSLTPLYEGQHLWLEYIERMRVGGFDVWFIQPEFVDVASGQTLQVNAMFCRRDLVKIWMADAAKQ
jgi:FkbM family methyltransferase